MKNATQFKKVTQRVVITLGPVAAVLLAGALLRSHAGQSPPPQVSTTVSPSTNTPAATVDLEASQLNAIKIAPVGSYEFPVEREAVGSIDYDEDLSVAVYSPYQGKILTALAELGDSVQKGQPLYTIESPDLIQAESTLIGAAATFELTSKELARAKDLSPTNGVSQRELEQATSDQQSAEGSLKAARDAVRIFGKTDAEIDHILQTRQIDPALVVRSPVSGRVTMRNAQPGLLVQPGSAPAPYSVADLSLKWMVANVTETDSPLFHVGQAVQARVMAYPDRIFTGKISRLGTAVDPNTHRVMVRCDLADPNDELRPGMLASFVIEVQPPAQAMAIPADGVVREGDGAMTAWVTTDRHRFTQRVITTGLRTQEEVQVLAGLRPGELVVTEGAVFLSNMLEAPPTD